MKMKWTQQCNYFLLSQQQQKKSLRINFKCANQKSRK